MTAAFEDFETSIEELHSSSSRSAPRTLTLRLPASVLASPTVSQPEARSTSCQRGASSPPIRSPPNVSVAIIALFVGCCLR
jgi:hypothetical protein